MARSDNVFAGFRIEAAIDEGYFVTPDARLGEYSGVLFAGPLDGALDYIRDNIVTRASALKPPSEEA